MSERLTLELILRPEVQRLLDHFAAVMKVRTVFFAADGSVLGSGRQAENCEYCRLMQAQVFSVEDCRKLDVQMQQACRKSRELTCYRCHAGLHELIAPVFADGQIGGYIMFGQFRSTGQMPKEAAANPEAAKAWNELPVYGEAELDDLIGLFRMLVDYVVARELVGWRGDRRMELVEHYLDVHLTEPVRLAALARHVGCSSSGLTHWLRDNYQCSFKELLIEKRLKRAEQLLKHHPEMNIGEIANAVGYDDRHYFSRIFRRYRGATPSALRG